MPLKRLLALVRHPKTLEKIRSLPRRRRRGKVFLDYSEKLLFLFHCRCSKRFVCDACGKLFYNQWNLKRHKEYLHSENMKKNFICDVCGALFTSEYQRRHHHIKRHGPRFKTKSTPHYACEQCGKKYRDTFNLIRHLKKHSGSATNENWCCYCGKSFRKDNLKVHVSTCKMPKRVTEDDKKINKVAVIVAKCFSKKKGFKIT